MAWAELAQLLSGRRERFVAGLNDCAARQHGQLQALLAANANSEFGRLHGFATIRDAEEYRRNVPLQDWSMVAPWVSRIANGEQGVLTGEPVVAFELTGGTRSGRKPIPQTPGLLAAFQAALLPWFDDWLSHWPGIGAGPMWWSITPAGRPQTLLETRLPLGLPGGDAAYFGAGFAQHLPALLAVPPQVAALDDLGLWRRVTLAYLLARADLSLISVWSPTLLLTLLDSLQTEADAILCLYDDWPPALPLPAITPARRAALPGLMAAGPAALWPQLALVSSWDRAGSASYAAELKQRWPGMPLQGKGLLATEGVVTLPLSGFTAPVLALDSGFYEFLDPAGQSWLAHELAPGACYEVVMSTAGGLYRYRMGDQVRVAGFAGTTPLLDFVGRAGGISDLCGEKLCESQVEAVLGQCCEGFAMLLADATARCYRLALPVERGEQAARWAEAVDAALGANPQYQYARQLGQLGPVQPWLLRQPLQLLQQASLAAGKRLGDLKPPALAGAAMQQILAEAAV